MTVSPGIENGSFDRPHIRDHSLRRKGFDECIFWLKQGLKRQRQNNKITALEASGIAADSIDKPALESTLRCAGPMHKALNTNPESTQIKADGTTDQAKAHNTNPVETSQICVPLLIHDCCSHPTHVARPTQGSKQLSLNR